MSSSVLYMSMSLDGFITGPDDDVGQGIGSGGERLHDWLGDGGDGVSGFRPSGPSGEIFDELMATGAVLVGRRTFDLAGRWDGDHHGVPIFVPTRGEPPAPASDLVNYVTDGIALSRLQLLEHAWDGEYENRSNVVDVHVKALRDRIDRPFGAESIETVRGVGYRMRAP
jgi:dihydrofolate reductase